MKDENNLIGWYSEKNQFRSRLDYHWWRLRWWILQRLGWEFTYNDEGIGVFRKRNATRRGERL